MSEDPNQYKEVFKLAKVERREVVCHECGSPKIKIDYNFPILDSCPAKVTYQCTNCNASFSDYDYSD